MTYSKYSQFLKESSPDLHTVIFEQQEEIKYLKEMAEKTVGRKGSKYNYTRSIVLNIHFRLDLMLSVILAITCNSGSQALGYKPKKPTEVLDKISEVKYFQKMEIVKKLSIFTEKSIKVFSDINKIRNAFAHNYKEGHSKYNYNEKSVFAKRTVERLIEDYDKVRKEYIDKVVQGKLKLIK